jgi:bis(5'-nucleosidyl)-tetraphosphatase
MSIKKDYSFGIIPIFKEPNGGFSVLILRHPGQPLRTQSNNNGDVLLSVAGFWGFPKGHKDDGEADIEAAKRELSEEAGIANCKIIEDVQFSDRYIFESTEGKLDKTVVYYPAFIGEKLAHLESAHNKEHGESIGLKWVGPMELPQYLTFKNQDILVKEILDWLNAQKDTA